MIRVEHSTIPHNQLLSQPHRGILILTVLFLFVHTIYVYSSATAKQMVNSWPSFHLRCCEKTKGMMAPFRCLLKLRNAYSFNKAYTHMAEFILLECKLLLFYPISSPVISFKKLDSMLPFLLTSPFCLPKLYSNRYNILNNPCDATIENKKKMYL